MARCQLAATAVEFWQGLFVPVGTPTGVTARLNQAAPAAATYQALVQDMAARGIIDIGSFPRNLANCSRWRRMNGRIWFERQVSRRTSK